MKKGLLIALGLTAGFGLAAQAPKIAGAKKADLKLSKTTTTDGNSSSFYASAHAAASRNSNPNAPLATGTYFSSSYNAFGLLVSQSNCLTADQALNAVLFTHRISQDWGPDANVSSGYIEYSWTTDCGQTWDSSYYADFTSLGNKRFRYPSGAIINPAGNTSVANAITVSAGPYTDGSSSAPWAGYYSNDQLMMNAATSNTTVYTNGQAGVTTLGMPRVDMASYSDSSVWVSAGRYADAALTGYKGAILMHGKYNGTNVSWMFDSIFPSLHQASDGSNDAWTQAHMTFSPNGQIGYVVFFGVDSAAYASGPATTHCFLPIVYKTTDGGANWNKLPMFDFTTLSVINDRLLTTWDGSIAKPFFSQDQGSDAVVDANGQLHIVCTIESSSTNDPDSLGSFWVLTGQNGTTARHYIYDVYTNANTWGAQLVDSLMTTTSNNTSIFVDGSNSSALYPTDARIQISANTTRDHLFFTWVDSDPLGVQGENALPDLYGKGLDITTGLWTARKQFTTSQDFFFHYVSNVALQNGNVYSLPTTNSIDRNGTHDISTTFNHYYLCGVDFNQSEFNVAIGISEENASFSTVAAYPNPANEQLNINVHMIKTDNVNITLFNSIGQSVMTENRNLGTGDNLVQLNTSNLPAGVYFVNVTADGQTSTSKIVIE
jgi:hypothetical protein